MGGRGGPGFVAVDVGGGGGVVSEGAVCCRRSNCHLALHSDGVRRILAPTDAQLGRPGVALQADKGLVFLR